MRHAGFLASSRLSPPDNQLEIAAGTMLVSGECLEYRVDGPLSMFRAAAEPLPPSKVRDSKDSIVTWDGRLDNGTELAARLGLAAALPDSTIVAKAFEEWREESFGRFVGDWAVSIWCGRSETLYLGRDFGATRPLFYRQLSGGVAWSSELRTLAVTLPAPGVDLDYAAMYIANDPAAHTSPFLQVFSVPPGQVLRFRNGSVHRLTAWLPSPHDTIRYGSSDDYVAHFFRLMQQAVSDRIAAGGHVLAELSGGLDSSSVVCVASTFRQGEGRSSLTAVSYVHERGHIDDEQQVRRRGAQQDWTAGCSGARGVILGV